MSRSGYIDDHDDILSLGRWRGQVASAFRGKRGQSFLKEALNALDALPQKELIADSLSHEGGYCMLGAVGRARGLDMSGIVDAHHSDAVANAFNIAEPMACEIMWMNDEQGWRFSDKRSETPAERWQRMRDWIASKIIKTDEEDR